MYLADPFYHTLAIRDIGPMTADRPLRIALLTHSTNPRGGVMHALALGHSLERLGQKVAVHAPDASGRGFFCESLCRTICLPAASPSGQDTTGMVEARIADYLRHFADPDHRRFDIWHAQDGISGNALATLKERGVIPGYVRTIHHIDHFSDPRLTALEMRSIEAADALLVVSRVWRDWLSTRFGRQAAIVGNGVDTERYSVMSDWSDPVIRDQLQIPADAPVFLSIGGVEERKNSLRLLAAFVAVQRNCPGAKLVIAGGASLLDHGIYQDRFSLALEKSGLPGDAVIRTGTIEHSLMPALYRMATALVFPSIREGFGLAVLEAMASGVPAIVSRIAPFTEYLAADDVIWCDPEDSGSIADAMRITLDPDPCSHFALRGLVKAGTHDWSNVAAAHLAVYSRMLTATAPQ